MPEPRQHSLRWCIQLNDIVRGMTDWQLYNWPRLQRVASHVQFVIEAREYLPTNP